MAPLFDVVISGMAGQFPNCDNVDELRDSLYNKRNMISVRNDQPVISSLEEFPPPKNHGLYRDKTRFDSRAFYVNNILANNTDCGTRKIQEVSVEAIMDAGVSLGALNGCNVGVYAGSYLMEGDMMKFLNAADNIDGKMCLMGLSRTMYANRLSYALNILGASVAIQGMSNTGVEALQQACYDIAHGLVESAVVTGASCLVDPQVNKTFAYFGVMSDDGLCRSFDQSANGYGRSEACVSLYLQRAEDAKRIYGQIIFAKSSMLGANPRALCDVRQDILYKCLAEFYQNENIKPTQVSFAELASSGVKKMEESECNALAEFFSHERKTPLPIGSVVSNLGFTDGCATLVSIVKCLLALDTNLIAPNINFSKPNTQIEAFAKNKLKVVSDITTLPGPIVAMNSVTYQGILSHVVVRQNEKHSEKSGSSISIQFPRLVLFAGRTETGVTEAIKKIESKPYDENLIALINESFKLPISIYSYRGFTILPTLPERKSSFISVTSNLKKPIWYVISGMGSQWNGMGANLMAIPLFAQTIKKLDNALRDTGYSVMRILTSDDPALFEDIVNAFIGIAAVQIGLIDILKAVGVEPDGIIGHSAGEVVCAYADGCCTAEQAIFFAYARGYASTQCASVCGSMAAVGMGYKEMQPMLPEGVEVACHNSKDSCTISGIRDQLRQCVKHLEDKKIFAREVNVSNIAFHSKYIKDLAPVLRRLCTQTFSGSVERSKRWISTSVPYEEWDSEKGKFSTEYLVNNLLSPVLFEEGCNRIPEDAILIEIAPHGLMQAILRRSEKPWINVPLTSKTATDSVHFLLAALGRLSVESVCVDINKLYSVKFPVPRNTPSVVPYISWDHADVWDGGQLHEFNLFDEIHYMGLTRGNPFNFLNGHCANDRKMLPVSFYLYAVWRKFADTMSKRPGFSTVVFEDVQIFENIPLDAEDIGLLFLKVFAGSGCFEISKGEDKRIIASGRIYQPYEKVTVKTDQLMATDEKVWINKWDKKEYYDILKKSGYLLLPPFDSTNRVFANDSECVGFVTWNKYWITFLESLLKMVVFVENYDKPTYFVKKIRKLTITTELFEYLTTGEEVKMHIENATKRATCVGLEMLGWHCDRIEEEHFKELTDSTLKMTPMEFISLKNPTLPNVDSFLRMSVTLVFDCMFSQSTSTDAKLNVIYWSENPLLRKIKTIIKNDNFMSKRSAFSSLAEVYEDQFYLFVCEREVDLFIFSLCEWENVFVLTNMPFEDGEEKPYDRLSFVTSQEFKKTRYALLKAEAECVESEADLSQKGSWSNAKGRMGHNDRDKLGLEPPVISAQKDGDWGIYYASPEDGDLFAKDIDPDTGHIAMDDIKINGVDIEYVCLEDCDFNHGMIKRNVNFAIEYSGVTSSGRRVMGLAFYDDLSKSFKPDPFFTWDIPDEWSMQEAATVPHNYLLAYNVIMKTRLEPNKSALLWSENITQREECIFALMIAMNCTVTFATNNSRSALRIRQVFPQVTVVTTNEEVIELNVKLLTRRKCCQVAINCGGSDVIREKLLELTSSYASYVELDNCRRENDFRNKQLGSYTFLREQTLHFIKCRMGSAIGICEDDKASLRKSMQNGIENGVVKPLLFSISHSYSQYFGSNSAHRKLLKMNADIKTNQLDRLGKFRADKSYIIFAGENSKLWLDHLEWMVEKGACNFVLALENNDLRTEISARIDQLKANKRCTVIIWPTEKLTYESNEVQLVKQACSLAPLHAVFFIETKHTATLIRNMNQATRDLEMCYFFNYERANSSSNSCTNVIPTLENCNQSGNPSSVLYYGNWIEEWSLLKPFVNHLLFHKEPFQSPVLHTLTQTQGTSIEITLRDYLPSNMALPKSNTQRSNYFEETLSLCPRYSETKGVTPVFIIPRFTKADCAQFSSKLFYPVFCATILENDSLTDVVERLTEEIKTIRPEGAITLIGEAWNGVIATEVGMKLETESRRKVGVILLEGSPVIWNHVATSTTQLATENQSMRCVDSNNNEVEECLDKESACISVDNMLQGKLKFAREYRVGNHSLDRILHVMRKRTFDRYVTNETLMIEDVKLFDCETYEELLSNELVIRCVNENLTYSSR